MQYFLTNDELERMKDGLLVAMAIPFIDDIEDYIVEALWEYVKGINGVDPLYNLRSKKLYDVVDVNTQRGWSVKSIQKEFYDGCEFELVIQRAAIYKKATALGFEPLNSESDPNRIGEALLKHWKIKVEGDAETQCVKDKRIMILLKTDDQKHFAVYEENIKLYSSEELYWEWSNKSKNGLKGYRKSDGMCVYRWYPSQTQFFERFILPPKTQKIDVTPIRLKKDQVVGLLLPLLEEKI